MGFPDELKAQLLAPFTKKPAEPATQTATPAQQGFPQGLAAQLLAPFQSNRSTASGGGSGGFSGGMSPIQTDDVTEYTRQRALSLGIDPNIALRVMNAEGGPNPGRQSDIIRADGSRETSYGPFQLFEGGGLGDEFKAKYGKSASDPSMWKQSVDFALEKASQGGWTPFHGAAAVGIGERDGIGGRPSTPQPISQQSRDSAWAGGDLTPDQFNSGLSSEDALAACGPAAAIAFARKNGRNPTMGEALELAKKVGWNSDQGMAGPESQIKLLRNMGVAAKLEGLDKNKIAADVQRGNPVIINASGNGGHYYVAERYDPTTGKFDFGNSAKILSKSGGNTWYTLDELAALGVGSPTAAIYMDSPESPSPSVVAGSSRSMLADNSSESPNSSRPESRSFKGMTYSETQSDPTLQSQQQIDTSSSDWGSDMPFVPNPVNGSTDASQDANPPVDAVQSSEPAPSQPEAPANPMQQFANTLASAAQALQESFKQPPVEPDLNAPTKFERQAQNRPDLAPPSGFLKPQSEQGAFSSGMEPTATEESVGVDLSRGQRPVIRSEAQAPNVTGPTRDTYAQEPVRGDPSKQFDTFQPAARTNEELLGEPAPSSDQGAMPLPRDIVQGADNLNRAIAEPLQKEKPAAVRGVADVQRATDYLSILGEADPQSQAVGIMERAGVPGHEDVGFSAGPIEVGPRELAGAVLGMAGPGGPGKNAAKVSGKMADDVVHVIGWGYKKGVSAEGRDLLERVAAKPISQSAQYTADDIAGWAATRGLSREQTEQLAHTWSRANTLDLAGEMSVLMRGSDAALAQADDLAKKIRDNQNATDEEKNALIDALAETTAADQFILGNKKASESVGRALNQLKFGMDPAESQAWLESLHHSQNAVDQVITDLGKVAKGKKAPTKGQIQQIERNLDIMDSGAGKLGDEDMPGQAKQGGYPEAPGPGGPQEKRGGYPKSEGPGGTAKEPGPPKPRKPGETATELARVMQEQQVAEDTGDVAKLHALEEQRQALVAEYRDAVKEKAMNAGRKARPGTSEEDLEATVRKHLAGRIEKLIKEDIANEAPDVAKQPNVTKQIADDIADSLIGRQAPDINPATQAKEAVKKTAREEKIATQMQNAMEKQMAKNLGKIDDMEQRAAVKGLYQRARTAAEKWLSGTVDETRPDGKVIKVTKSAQQQIKDEEEYRAALLGLKDESRSIGKPNLADDLEASINARSQKMAQRAEEATMRKDQNDLFRAGERVVSKRKAAEIKSVVGEIREILKVMRENPRETFREGFAQDIGDRLARLNEISDQGKKRSTEMLDSMRKSGMQRMVGRDKSQSESERAIFMAALLKTDMRDPAQMRRFMDNVAQGSVAGMAIEYAIASMLSSPATHVLNFLSNTAMGVANFGFKQPLESAMLAKGGHASFSAEKAGALRGINEGLGRGLGMAGEIMKTGSTLEGRTRAGMLADFSDVNRELLTERLGPLGAVMHMVSTRPLEAADTIFGQMFYNANLQILADRKARVLTKAGKPTTAADIIANLDKHLDVISKAGKLSDYSLLKSTSGVTPSSMVAHAVRDVGTRYDPGKADMARLAIHAFFPFMRTPYNFFRQGVAYSPIGTIAKGAQLAYGLKRGTLARSADNGGIARTAAEEAANLTADIAAGAALAATAIGLYSAGVITGDGPTDANLRKTMIDTGWQPRSIKMGDKWVSYDSLPVTIPFTSVVTALERGADASKEANAKGANVALAAAGGLVQGAGSAISGQSMVRQAGDLYELARMNENTAGSVTSSLASNIATRAIPGGGALAYFARMGDDYVRETRMVDKDVADIPGSGTVIARIQERTPLRGGLPIALGATGAERKNDRHAPFVGPRQSAEKNNDVAKTLVGLGVGVSPPPRSTKDNLGREFELSADERREYLSMMNRALQANMRGVRRAEDAEKEVDKAREIALAHVKSMHR